MHVRCPCIAHACSVCACVSRCVYQQPLSLGDAILPSKREPLTRR